VTFCKPNEIFLPRHLPQAPTAELTCDNGRVSNSDQVSRVVHLALKRGKSVDFTGYWQRNIVD
jgi:hypothetical protein